MERTEEYEFDSAGSLGTAVDQSVEFLETDLAEHEHLGAESVYTDDPVRVYLREMGSVRLLNRQGEIDLARRMERGKLLMRKALSRSPLVWKSVLALHEEVRKGDARLEDFMEMGGADDDARSSARHEANRRFT